MEARSIRNQDVPMQLQVRAGQQSVGYVDLETRPRLAPIQVRSSPLAQKAKPSSHSTPSQDTDHQPPNGVAIDAMCVACS